MFIPQLPESAPFTPEQRAYLNGFFAGMFSRVPAGQGPAAPAAQPLTPLSILFGSQTGNSENLAKRIAKEAGKRGFAPTIHDLGKYAVAQLASEQCLLIVTSTYGDGEPPDNAKSFWEFLKGDAAPRLERARYSVCALGDSNYPKFCGFGREMDSRFEALGAQRVQPRADCDVEFEEPFNKWVDAALNGLRGTESAPAATEVRTEKENSPATTPAPSYGRGNPFPAVLLENRRLNSDGSGKDTRHFEMELNGSGLSYEAGDALGVIPSNCPELVEDLLAALKFGGDEPVPGRNGSVPVRDALLRDCEITKIPRNFLQLMAERSRDELLTKLVAPGTNGELGKFLWGREIIDLVLAHPEVKFAPAEFVALLRKLPPRLYSISSSPKAHAGRVHVTVNIVRYESLARRRKGVCSTYLAERIPANAPVPVFIHTNNNFRPPRNNDLPMIMVGPGTGIAPFRGFLHERRALGAKGRNWLFFGDQRAATDFMYREELETMLSDGSLARLTTAFSRDQEQKIYVQHRMAEHAKELLDWLEAGAHFYVCGDANRMARDVDAALHEAICSAGGRTPEQAAEYVKKLKAEKRYQRDVY